MTDWLMVWGAGLLVFSLLVLLLSKPQPESDIPYWIRKEGRKGWEG